MIKGFRQIASLTALSRVVGMLRDIAFAYFLGASGLMDGWTIGFKIPNLARRLFGEGAASSSIIPVYSEQLHKDPEEAKRLAYTVVTVIFVLLSAIVLLGEGFILVYYNFFAGLEGTQLKLKLSAIMLPDMTLVCVVAVLSGILNAHRHFAAPAASPIVLNLFLIGSLCLSAWMFGMEASTQVFVVAVTVILAGIVQVFMQLPPLWARRIYIRPAWHVHSEAFKKVILLMAPMILGFTATQINTLADDFMALWFSGSLEKGEFFSLFGARIKYPLWEGAVSQLFYSQRLYQFPLGVFGISLATAIFPVMSAEAAAKDIKAFCATVARGLRCTVFIALPATVGLLLVARPLVAVLFERGRFTDYDTGWTAWTLSFYALGLCGYCAQHVIVYAFYSLQDSKLPAKSAAISVAVNIVLNLTLMWFLGTGGLAVSTALCSYLQVVILVVALRRRLGGAVAEGFVPALWKTTAATLLMSAAVLVALGFSRGLPNTIKLLLAVPAGTIAYLLTAKYLRIEMLSLLTGTKPAAGGVDLQ